MSTDINAIRLNDEGSPFDGIIGVKGTQLWVGPQISRERVRAPFVPNPKDGSLPRVERDLLLEAAPTRMPGGYPAFEGRGTWRGTLVFVETARLAFPAEHSSHFGDIGNQWRGAEIIGGAHIQVGERNVADQLQIIAIREGESVIVCDSWGRYITLYFTDGILQPFPSEKEELGSVLVKRLERRLPNVGHQALKWTWHALKRLGLAHMWTQPLERRMRSLEAPIKRR